MQDTRSLPHLQFTALHLDGCHFYALAAIEFNKFRLCPPVGLAAILTTREIFSPTPRRDHFHRFPPSSFIHSQRN